MNNLDIGQAIAQVAKDAKLAARKVASAPAAVREQALRATATRILADRAKIEEANRVDLEAGQKSGLSDAMLDRLRLDGDRIDLVAATVDEVADMADVILTIENEQTRPNGLSVAKMRIPLGVICIIYESRPNVTTDAFALCLRSANAVILRGGKEAMRTSLALGDAISAGLYEAGLPRTAAQVVPFSDREGITQLLLREDEIDLVIPRGGEQLIRFVSKNSRVPVIQHYKGVCHVVVDKSADHDMAIDICENAKVSRPGVCNSCETILVHEAVARNFVPRLVARLVARGVEVRGDEAVCALSAQARAASEDDWHAEYLALTVAIKVVPSLQAAIDHIDTYGSQHTEAIVTADDQAAQSFINNVHSSTVMVNASTRFADGGELGLGAEIGISTSKLHAYGPMGARELTTTKFVVRGTGHVRA